MSLSKQKGMSRIECKRVEFLFFSKRFGDAVDLYTKAIGMLNSTEGTANKILHERNEPHRAVVPHQ
jgi:hypothetical protein